MYCTGRSCVTFAPIRQDNLTGLIFMPVSSNTNGWKRMLCFSHLSDTYEQSKHTRQFPILPKQLLSVCCQVVQYIFVTQLLLHSHKQETVGVVSIKYDGICILITSICFICWSLLLVTFPPWSTLVSTWWVTITDTFRVLSCTALHATTIPVSHSWPSILNSSFQQDPSSLPQGGKS